MGEMEKQLLEVEKGREEPKKCMNQAIKHCSLAEELYIDAEEREQKAVTNLQTFQRQRRE